MKKHISRCRVISFVSMFIGRKWSCFVGKAWCRFHCFRPFYSVRGMQLISVALFTGIRVWHLWFRRRWLSCTSFAGRTKSGCTIVLLNLLSFYIFFCFLRFWCMTFFSCWRYAFIFRFCICIWSCSYMFAAFHMYISRLLFLCLYFCHWLKWLGNNVVMKEATSGSSCFIWVHSHSQMPTSLYLRASQ